MLGVALAYGGIVQVLAGMWEFRTGNTFGAVVFSSFGAFWISFFILVQVVGAPALLQPHAVSVYLYGWAIFTLLLLVASLRTTGVIAVVFVLLTITFFLLAIGWANAAKLQRHRLDPLGRLLRARHGGRRVVRSVRRGRQLNLRPRSPARGSAEALRGAEEARSTSNSGHNRHRPIDSTSAGGFASALGLPGRDRERRNERRSTAAKAPGAHRAGARRNKAVCTCSLACDHRPHIATITTSPRHSAATISTKEDFFSA